MAIELKHPHVRWNGEYHTTEYRGSSKMIRCHGCDVSLEPTGYADSSHPLHKVALTAVDSRSLPGASVIQFPVEMIPTLIGVLLDAYVAANTDEMDFAIMIPEGENATPAA